MGRMTNEERVLANNGEVLKMTESSMNTFVSSEQKTITILAIINDNLTQISLSLAIIADILSKMSDSSDGVKEDYHDEREN